MKFLPQIYRESQADWFAKRGISRHISVIVRKKSGSIQSQSIIHVVKNTSQNSDAVVWILKQVFTALKKEHPEIKRAFLRKMMRGAIIVSECLLLSRHTGILIKRVDFNDPKGDKDPCDRKAVTTKGHVRRYVNEGNDVLTPANFKDAILSHGGVSGVRVALVDTVIDETVATKGKWKGISTLNNFSYTNNEECVTVWRAYNVGKGKSLQWSKVPGENQYEII